MTSSTLSGKAPLGSSASPKAGAKGVLGFLIAFMVEALTKGFLVFIIVLRHEGWVISAVSAVSIVSWVPLAVSFVCLVGPAPSISAAVKRPVLCVHDLIGHVKGSVHSCPARDSQVGEDFGDLDSPCCASSGPHA